MTTITVYEINCVYSDAAEAVRAYAAAAAHAIEVKESLKDEEAIHINAGALDGLKNDTARDAKLRGLCGVRLALLAGAEADEALARGEDEARKLEVERIEMLIRLAELGTS